MGDAFGKWFGRYLDKVGIADPAKVAHSFRHTANTKLHELHVSTAYILALIGHEGKGVNETEYLHGAQHFPIESLRDEIEKLNWRECLKDLPVLWARAAVNSPLPRR